MGLQRWENLSCFLGDRVRMVLALRLRVHRLPSSVASPLVKFSEPMNISAAWRESIRLSMLCLTIGYTDLFV